MFTNQRAVQPYHLHLNIKNAKDLVIADQLSSDPYVCIYIGKKRIGLTGIIRINRSPIWNEEFLVPLMNKDVKLTLRVFDHDDYGMDDKMGKIEINLALIPLNETTELTLPLSLDDGQVLAAQGVLAFSIKLLEKGDFFLITKRKDFKKTLFNDLYDNVYHNHYHNPNLITLRQNVCDNLFKSGFAMTDALREVFSNVPSFRKDVYDKELIIDLLNDCMGVVSNDERDQTGQILKDRDMFNASSRFDLILGDYQTCIPVTPSRTHTFTNTMPFMLRLEVESGYHTIWFAQKFAMWAFILRLRKLFSIHLGTAAANDEQIEGFESVGGWSSTFQCDACVCTKGGIEGEGQMVFEVIADSTKGDGEILSHVTTNTTSTSSNNGNNNNGDEGDDHDNDNDDESIMDFVIKLNVTSSSTKSDHITLSCVGLRALIVGSDYNKPFKYDLKVEILDGDLSSRSNSGSKSVSDSGNNSGGSRSVGLHKNLGSKNEYIASQINKSIDISTTDTDRIADTTPTHTTLTRATSDTDARCSTFIVGASAECGFGMGDDNRKLSVIDNDNSSNSHNIDDNDDNADTNAGKTNRLVHTSSVNAYSALNNNGNINSSDNHRPSFASGLIAQETLNARSFISGDFTSSTFARSFDIHADRYAVSPPHKRHNEGSFVTFKYPSLPVLITKPKAGALPSWNEVINFTVPHREVNGRSKSFIILYLWSNVQGQATIIGEKTIPISSLFIGPRLTMNPLNNDYDNDALSSSARITKSAVEGEDKIRDTGILTTGVNIIDTVPTMGACYFQTIAMNETVTLRIRLQTLNAICPPLDVTTGCIDKEKRDIYVKARLVKWNGDRMERHSGGKQRSSTMSNCDRDVHWPSDSLSSSSFTFTSNDGLDWADYIQLKVMDSKRRRLRGGVNIFATTDQCVGYSLIPIADFQLQERSLSYALLPTEEVSLEMLHIGLGNMKVQLKRICKIKPGASPSVAIRARLNDSNIYNTMWPCSVVLAASIFDKKQNPEEMLIFPSHGALILLDLQRRNDSLTNGLQSFIQSTSLHSAQTSGLETEREVVVYENESRLTLFSSWTPEPFTRPAFSDETGTMRYPFGSIYSTICPDGWTWAGDWVVDRDYCEVDTDGWCYGISFELIMAGYRRGTTTSDPNLRTTRRRRWKRRLKHANAGKSSETFASSSVSNDTPKLFNREKLREENPDLVLGLCNEIDPFTGRVRIPWGRVGRIDCITGTVLAIHCKVSRFVGVQKIGNKKQEQFQDVDVVLHVTQCPAASLRGLMSERQQLFYVREDIKAIAQEGALTSEGMAEAVVSSDARSLGSEKVQVIDECITELEEELDALDILAGKASQRTARELQGVPSRKESAAGLRTKGDTEDSKTQPKIRTSSAIGNEMEDGDNGLAVTDFQSMFLVGAREEIGNGMGIAQGSSLLDTLSNMKVTSDNEKNEFITDSKSGKSGKSVGYSNKVVTSPSGRAVYTSPNQIRTYAHGIIGAENSKNAVYKYIDETNLNSYRSGKSYGGYSRSGTSMSMGDRSARAGSNDIGYDDDDDDDDNNNNNAEMLGSRPSLINMGLLSLDPKNFEDADSEATAHMLSLPVQTWRLAVPTEREYYIATGAASITRGGLTMPQAERKLFLIRGISRLKLYMGVLLGFGLQCAHDFSLNSVQKLVERDILIATSIADNGDSDDEAETDSEVSGASEAIIYLSRLAESRIRDTVLCGWYHRGGQLESCLQLMINKYYNFIVAMLSQFFKLTGLESLKGVSTKLELIKFFIEQDYSFSNTISVALSPFKLKCVPEPSLSQSLDFGKLISWYGKTIKDEMCNFIENTLQVASNNAAATIEDPDSFFTQNFPWIPMQISSGPIISNIPEDCVFALQQVILHARPPRKKFSVQNHSQLLESLDVALADGFFYAFEFLAYQQLEIMEGIDWTRPLKDQGSSAIDNKNSSGFFNSVVSSLGFVAKNLPVVSSIRKIKKFRDKRKTKQNFAKGGGVGVVLDKSTGAVTGNDKGKSSVELSEEEMQAVDEHVAFLASVANDSLRLLTNRSLERLVVSLLGQGKAAKLESMSPLGSASGSNDIQGQLGDLDESSDRFIERDGGQKSFLSQITKLSDRPYRKLTELCTKALHSLSRVIFSTHAVREILSGRYVFELMTKMEAEANDPTIVEEDEIEDRDNNDIISIVGRFNHQSQSHTTPLKPIKTSDGSFSSSYPNGQNKSSSSIGKLNRSRQSFFSSSIFRFTLGVMRERSGRGGKRSSGTNGGQLKDVWLAAILTKSQSPLLGILDALATELDYSRPLLESYSFGKLLEICADKISLLYLLVVVELNDETSVFTRSMGKSLANDISKLIEFFMNQCASLQDLNAKVALTTSSQIMATLQWLQVVQDLMIEESDEKSVIQVQQLLNNAMEWHPVETCSQCRLIHTIVQLRIKMSKNDKTELEEAMSYLNDENPNPLAMADSRTPKNKLKSRGSALSSFFSNSTNNEEVQSDVLPVDIEWADVLASITRNGAAAAIFEARSVSKADALKRKRGKVTGAILSPSVSVLQLGMGPLSGNEYVDELKMSMKDSPIFYLTAYEMLRGSSTKLKNDLDIFLATREQNHVKVALTHDLLGSDENRSNIYVRGDNDNLNGNTTSNNNQNNNDDDNNNSTIDTTTNGIATSTSLDESHVFYNEESTHKLDLKTSCNIIFSNCSVTGLVTLNRLRKTAIIYKVGLISSMERYPEIDQIEWLGESNVIKTWKADARNYWRGQSLQLTCHDNRQLTTSDLIIGIFYQAGLYGADQYIASTRINAGLLDICNVEEKDLPLSFTEEDSIVSQLLTDDDPDPHNVKSFFTSNIEKQNGN